MGHKQLFALPVLVLVLAALAFFAVASANDKDKIGPYQFLTTIAIPGGGPTSFDISWVDSASERYYLAERTSTPNTGRIDVIDAEHDTFLYSIGGFVGNQGLDKSGPNGVVVINKLNEAWAGDGDSTVKVVDLAARAVVDTIYTGGTFRADELAYDPLNHMILIANDADTPPFVTFISTKTRTVAGHLAYPQATGGLEQPVWDRQTKRFYLAVPSTTTNPHGEIDRINPKTMTVTGVFPTTCNPAGLALLPHQRLMTSCGDVINARTGAPVAHVNGVAADEIWYNPGDERVYFGHNPAAVVDAETYQVITMIAAGPTHSVAADSENNHIFIPVTGMGVKVYTDSEDQEGHSDK